VKPNGKTEIAITWGDGHVSTYSMRYLRQQCPCALCVDELTREKRLDASTIPSDIHVLSITPVGNYALRFDWSDGHNTGIYPYDHLRTLCPCRECVSPGRRR